MAFRLLSKYRKKLILPVTLLLAIIGFITIYFILNITSHTNDECLWKEEKVGDDSLRIYFDLVKYKGVTWNAGIRDGDDFIAIDGKKLRNTYHASYLADRKPSGDSLIFTVSRNGQLFDTTIRVKKIIGFGNLAISLLGLIWLAVGFVVLSSKPYGFPQILFYRIGALFVMFSTGALFGGNNILNPIWKYPVLMVFIDLIWVFGIVFLPFLLVHFFWIFPFENRIIKIKYVSKLLFTIPGILYIGAVIYRSFFIYTSMNYEKALIPYHMPFIVSLNILLFIGIVIGLISLFVSYLKLKQASERTSIFVILISYTVGVLALVYLITLADVLADSIFNSPEYFLPIFLIILTPLGFGYSIFRYSLLDVSDVLKNTILYGTATFTLAGIYFLIIYSLGQSISGALTTEYQGIVAAGIFIIFAYVFQSTKDRFQNIITKYFYPEQFAYQKVLMKFSNEISSIVGLDNILDTVKETFVDALKVEKFGIALRNKSNNEFELKREDGFINKQLHFTNNEDVISNKVLEKLELKHPNAFDQLEFPAIFPCAHKDLEEEGIYTIIPMVMKQKIIGLLLFGLKHSGAQFAGKDIDLLVAASNQTAIAIENARLYDEEAKKIKLERELDVARKIQEGLLPVHVPQIKNLDTAGVMIPAMQIGGDYYDLIKVSETQMFIVVGDVSGKGLSASFYMSKLQTMIQLFCTGTKSPKEVLVELNQKIAGNIDKQWFITLTIAFVDVAKRSIKICRAGHTPTIKFSSGVVNYIKPNGIGVGLEFGKLFEDSLEETEIPLAPHDIFVFTSDGINEAMNEENNFFGYNEIVKILKEKSNANSKDIVNETIKSLEKFRGVKEPNDDITCVVLKIL
ncbi:MAG: SpoIIE family protein phosphatase [Ignavibacteriales bacterium]|nr:SpoIIE family protein phosphatase [Ignavibacteriales bacterium]